MLHILLHIFHGDSYVVKVLILKVYLGAGG